MNSFGEKFRFTTFGESHGKAIGCIVDGVPAGLEIDVDFIQSELDKRRPGKSKFATPRDEKDIVEILSGTFEGVSTGTPISMVIFNTNQKSKDYTNIKDIFRPGHADFTYFHKYGLRDYRGGGRSSARETAARVAAGAIAQLLLNTLNISVQSGIAQIGDIKSINCDFDYSATSEIFALDKDVEQKQKDKILEVKNNHNSVGGVALVRVQNAPKGLGEPIYSKLDAVLASAMMSINGVKAVEIGNGIDSSSMTASQNNDEITSNGFITNNSGGILGGISNGDDIIVKVHFKPTPSIFVPQKTVNTTNEDVNCNLKGRHDPCIATRGSVVAKAMMSCVVADMLLLNLSSNINNIKKVYS